MAAPTAAMASPPLLLLVLTQLLACAGITIDLSLPGGGGDGVFSSSKQRNLASKFENGFADGPEYDPFDDRRLPAEKFFICEVGPMGRDIYKSQGSCNTCLHHPASKAGECFCTHGWRGSNGPLPLMAATGGNTRLSKVNLEQGFADYASCSQAIYEAMQNNTWNLSNTSNPTAACTRLRVELLTPPGLPHSGGYTPMFYASPGGGLHGRDYDPQTRTCTLKDSGKSECFSSSGWMSARSASAADWSSQELYTRMENDLKHETVWPEDKHLQNELENPEQYVKWRVNTLQGWAFALFHLDPGFTTEGECIKSCTRFASACSCDCVLVTKQFTAAEKMQIDLQLKADNWAMDKDLLEKNSLADICVNKEYIGDGTTEFNCNLIPHAMRQPILLEANCYGLRLRAVIDECKTVSGVWECREADGAAIAMAAPGGHYHEVYRGSAKAAEDIILTGLVSSSQYKFITAAWNRHGQGPWTEEKIYRTKCGSLEECDTAKWDSDKAKWAAALPDCCLLNENMAMTACPAAIEAPVFFNRTKECITVGWNTPPNSAILALLKVPSNNFLLQMRKGLPGGQLSEWREAYFGPLQIVGVCKPPGKKSLDEAIPYHFRVMGVNRVGGGVPSLPAIFYPFGGPFGFVDPDKRGFFEAELGQGDKGKDSSAYTGPSSGMAVVQMSDL